MFGFSLPKFLLFALLVAIVWFGFRYVNRVEQIRRAVREELKRRQPPGRRKQQTIEAEDLVKCSQCGAYVAARSASSCGRPDCPWGR
jgi:ribosomal protein L32